MVAVSATRIYVTDKGLKSYGFRRTRKTNIEDISPEDGDQNVGPVEQSPTGSATVSDAANGSSYAEKHKLVLKPALKSATGSKDKNRLKLSNFSIKSFNQAVVRSSAIRVKSRDTCLLLPYMQQGSQSQLHANDVPTSTCAMPSRQDSSDNSESGGDKTSEGNGVHPYLPRLGLPLANASPEPNKATLLREHEELTHTQPSTTSCTPTFLSPTDSWSSSANPAREGHASLSHKRAQSSGGNHCYDRRKEMEKEVFERSIDILRQWYPKLPIISHQNSRTVDASTIEPPIKKPTMFENRGLLDIRFSLGHITDVLTCPLCKGLFYNAHTIKECMHTFCKSCLVMYTVEHGLSCPKCHVTLPMDGLEGVDYDNNIQGLVDKLFPNFSKREARQMESIRKIMSLGVESMPTFCVNTDLISSHRPGEPDVTPQPSGDDVKLASHNGTMFSEYIQCNTQLYTNRVPDNITFVALLHEDDHPEMQSLIFDADGYLQKHRKSCGGIEACMPSDDFLGSRYRGMYIGIPRYTLVADLCRFVASNHRIAQGSEVQLSLKGMRMHKNHTVEFICRMMKIDVTKCVLMRFKVLEVAVETLP